MLEEKRYENGAIDISVNLRYEYNETKREDGILIERRIVKTATFNPSHFDKLSGLSLFSEIAQAQKAFNTALADIKGLLMAGTYVATTLSISANERVEAYVQEDIPGHPMECRYKSLQFDAWEAKESCIDGDPTEEGAGLYFRPDTKYTDENRDLILYWGKDVFQSLAEARL